MSDGKIVQIVPAEAGWSAVFPADGVDRVRLSPVACWAIVEGTTGGREVVPLLGGPFRALVVPGPDALGIAGPGERAADWAERLVALPPAAPDPTPAPAPRAPAPTPTPPPSPRADIPGADVLDD